MVRIRSRSPGDLMLFQCPRYAKPAASSPEHALRNRRIRFARASFVTERDCRIDSDRRSEIADRRSQSAGAKPTTHRTSALTSLCNLCVLCVSVVKAFSWEQQGTFHHRATENTARAQRKLK